MALMAVQNSNPQISIAAQGHTQKLLTPHTQRGNQDWKKVRTFYSATIPCGGPGSLEKSPGNQRAFSDFSILAGKVRTNSVRTSLQNCGFLLVGL
jgi:hypothetical protein